MQQYDNQRYEFKQQEVIYFHGGVRLYKNERQMPYIETGEEKCYYLYDIEEYTQIEYTEKLTGELENSKQEIINLSNLLESSESRITCNEDTLLAIILGGI